MIPAKSIEPVDYQFRQNKKLMKSVSEQSNTIKKHNTLNLSKNITIPSDDDEFNDDDEDYDYDRDSMFKQLHCNDMDFLNGESSSEDDEKRKKMLLTRSNARLFQS